MNRRVKKCLLLALAAALLFSAGRMQQSMNRDRETLGLTRTTVLENAPPALAFTTVALGGFRGLISNFLWIRATDLQQDDKYFEAAQLADWITKLEPTYTQVWLFQAWNMAYNISVKFKENGPGDYSDRWRWLERGIELLRDDGLRYNPNSILIYRELGWFFQHKMGQNLDDANMYYKQQWATQMTNFFGLKGTNFGPLLNPQTALDYQRLQRFTNQYKMDPVLVQTVDNKYGPFDWLLPEAHAIYWGAKALDEAAKNPGKVSAEDLITVRRIIYQSLLQAFKHGRVLSDPTGHVYLGPNLDLVGQVNKAYLDLYAEETSPAMRDGILKAHRNFLRDAIYFLYEADRLGEARKWFNYLGEKYPDKPIIENQPDSLPKNLTLDEYAVAVVQIDIGEMSLERVTAAIEGLLLQSYVSLAGGQDDRYENLARLASRVHDRFVAKTTGFKGLDRLPLMPLNDMKAEVLRQLVDPQSGLPYAARATLVSRLGLPTALLETTANPADSMATNAVPENSTNSPSALPVSPVAP